MQKTNPTLLQRLSTGSYAVSRTDTFQQILIVTASCAEEACLRAWAVREQVVGLPDDPDLLVAIECDDPVITEAAMSIAYYIVIQEAIIDLH